MSAWWILVAIIAFICLVLGLFLFPSVHQVCIGIDTSQGGYIENGIHTLTPYGFLAAILIGIVGLIRGKQNQ